MLRVRVGRTPVGHLVVFKMKRDKVENFASLRPEYEWNALTEMLFADT